MIFLFVFMIVFLFVFIIVFLFVFMEKWGSMPSVRLVFQHDLRSAFLAVSI